MLPHTREISIKDEIEATIVPVNYEKLIRDGILTTDGNSYFLCSNIELDQLPLELKLKIRSFDSTTRKLVLHHRK